MGEPTPNRTLYESGLRYVRLVNRVRTLEDVAETEDDGLKEVRTAFDFATDVNVITKVVPGAHDLILDGDNPHLTPSIVQQIARRKETGIRTTVERAAAGLHPFAPDPPADWHGERALCHYDFERLGKAQALLERVGKAIERPGPALSAAVRTEVTVHAAAIGADLDAVRLALDTAKRRPAVVPRRQRLKTRPEVVEWAEDARKWVEAVTGDILRAVQTRSLGVVRDELGQRVSAVASLAERIRALLPDTISAANAPEVVTNSSRIFDTPGTYVVVLRADKAGVVRIARLGTFGLPKGYLLYVGSAFGTEGVAGRTARHLGGTGPRLWGVDYLRGFAEPVELWWTHHSEKVECDWARALAGMPICSCPAPLAGASDCNGCRQSGDRKGLEQRCPAHLFYTPERLPIEEFAGQLGRSGSGGYEVRC